MPARVWLGTPVLVIATLGLALAQSAKKEPVVPSPSLSPLELVRGLREAGMTELALEYLREIEKKPLSDADRQAIPLERARCLLDAAEEEPDEGTRTSMVGEAKEAFTDFLTKNPKHPRASEASLAIARLTSIEAKAQLNRARRMEVPSEPASDAPDRGEKEKERDAALAKQRDEAKKAQPLFLLASKRFAEAAQQLRIRRDDKSLPLVTRQNLAREVFDAELAAAINQYNLADTVVAANAAATQERVKYLEEARDGFATLAKGPPTSRNVWIARAWMAETLMDQSRPNEANPEFDAILKSTYLEAEAGKRLVQFFQIRRNYLEVLGSRQIVSADLEKVERRLRDWLDRYGRTRKPSAEVLAARYYRAFALQRLAQGGIVIPKDGKPPVIGATARAQLTQAEQLYRELAHSDNDYTVRATRNRMTVVRLLLGEADKPATEYTTFESAQMASLIQIAKLSDAERALGKTLAKRNALAQTGGKPFAVIGAELEHLRAEAEIPHRKFRIIALLQRARSLATPQENPGDVADTLLRLVYFHQSAKEPYQAAVLGENIARTIRSTGGKSAAAGLLAVNGYMSAAAQIKVDRSDPARIEEAEAAAEVWRKVDREHAVNLARYLDKTYPNDVATDAVRHRLALLLVQEKRFDQAFDAVTKVRAGYSELTNARELEAFIAGQLINGPKDMPLPPGGKVAVFRRAVDDLARVVKPNPDAPEEDVRGYLAVRARLGLLYLAQSRADPEREKRQPGYERALALADEMIAAVPTFGCMNETDGAGKKLNLNGRELHLLGEDLHTRAVFLRGRALLDGGADKLPAATKALQPVIADVSKTGALWNEKAKHWASGEPGDPPEVVTQKGRIGGLMAGIDKVRSDTVMLGFKLSVRQGKPDEAAKMLNLLKKTGGSVADNQSTYEFMARELAAPIPGLKRQKKDAEAKLLGDGVALLLKELAGVPNLSPSSILFIGQTLYTVDRHEDALKEFAKIKEPSRPDWAKIELDKINDGQERNKLRDEIRNYRFAQLYTARALRSLNKIVEAEKLLTTIVGTREAHGWGYGSYDFRRELALMYEAKAAAITEKKAAIVVWGQALKEWTMLFQIAQSRVKNLPPNADPAQVRETKSAFFDAYYEIQRVMVAANTRLQSGAALKKSLDTVGKRIADMENSNKLAELEKAGQSIITPEVWNHFADLLEANQAVKEAYAANGGKLFLERPAN